MKKEKTNRGNKGITLIALIITIIVMLILVGVTISVSLNGGLFNTAKQATNKTQIAGEREQLLMVTMGALGENGKVDYTKIDSNLPEGFEGRQGIYTNIKTGTRYKIGRNGQIALVEALEVGVNQYKTTKIAITPIMDYEQILTESEAVKILAQAFSIPGEIETLAEFNLAAASTEGITSEEELKAWVTQETGIENPTDKEVFSVLVATLDYYVSSPQELVIEEGLYQPEEIKLTINNEDKTAIYNQAGFEYDVVAGETYTIELEINGIIATKTVQITEGAPYNWDTNKVAVRTEGQTYIPVPRGFEVSTETNEDETTEGLVIKDGENEFVWVPVSNAQTYTEDNFGPLRDKDENSGYSYDSYQTIQYYYGNTLGEMNSAERFNQIFTYGEDKENVERSIRTYGGFYVGRYETTYDGIANGIPQGIGVKQNKDVLSADNILQTGTNETNNDEYHYRWWGLYKAQKDMYADNTNIGSIMISSKQWDEIMTFTNYGDESRPTNSYENLDDMYGYGSKPDKSGSTYSTDNTKYDVANNIYDLAGNMYEYTVTVANTRVRWSRGGGYHGAFGNSASNIVDYGYLDTAGSYRRI